jgi:hypothetical protein
MDFLNQTEGGMVFFQFPVRNCKRLREFEEIDSQNKAVEVTVNKKEENS